MEERKSQSAVQYHFLDETIDKQYVKEIQTGGIFTWFSFIAVFISSLGLYGLTIFMIENRTKEIGVRKVLGASVLGILKLFYKGICQMGIAGKPNCLPYCILFNE